MGSTTHPQNTPQGCIMWPDTGSDIIHPLPPVNRMTDRCLWKHYFPLPSVINQLSHFYTGAYTNAEYVQGFKSYNHYSLSTQSSFSQTHNIGNIAIVANFIFPYNLNVPFYLHHVMLVNVKLDVSRLFQDCRLLMVQLKQSCQYWTLVLQRVCSICSTLKFMLIQMQKCENDSRCWHKSKCQVWKDLKPVNPWYSRPQYHDRKWNIPFDWPQVTMDLFQSD